MKPRRFVFGIRSLLLAGLLVSVASSWLGLNLDRARRQGRAVRRLQTNGAFVAYQHQWDERAGRYDFTAELPVPKWIRSVLGDDFFARADRIVIADSDFDDDDLSDLRTLTSLRFLVIGKTRITDVGLRHLDGLHQLESLGFGEAAITGAGLKHLDALSELESLSFSLTGITDAALVHLQRLKQLEYLSIHGCNVSLEAVEKLAEALPHTYITYSAPLPPTPMNEGQKLEALLMSETIVFPGERGR